MGRQLREFFTELKDFLASSSVIQKPMPGQPIMVYLSVSREAVSFVLVQEVNRKQRPIYFISRTLQKAKMRYQMIKKIALALITAVRRMRAYFQNHAIVVKTNYLIVKILGKPDLAGWMIGWAVELSEYEIWYELGGAVRSQCLTDFVAEICHGLEKMQPATWTLHVDGSSNSKEAGAGIVLERLGEFVVEQSLKFGFKTSNNQGEYETLLAGLELACDMGADHLTCHSDSQLIVGQLRGKFQVKDPLLAKYCHRAQAILQKFKEVKVIHIKQEHNERVDLLSKLASTKKRSCHKSFIRQLLATPSELRVSWGPNHWSQERMVWPNQTFRA